jgi:hypothetical protein
LGSSALPARRSVLRAANPFGYGGATVEMLDLRLYFSGGLLVLSASAEIGPILTRPGCADAHLQVAPTRTKIPRSIRVRGKLVSVYGGCQFELLLSDSHWVGSVCTKPRARGLLLVRSVLLRDCPSRAPVPLAPSPWPAPAAAGALVGRRAPRTQASGVAAGSFPARGTSRWRLPLGSVP